MNQQLLIEAFKKEFLSKVKNQNSTTVKKGFWINLFAIFKNDIVELRFDRKAGNNFILRYLECASLKLFDEKELFAKLFENIPHLSSYLNNYLRNFTPVKSEKINTVFEPPVFTGATNLEGASQTKKPKRGEKIDLLSGFSFSYFLKNKQIFSRFLRARQNDELTDLVDLMIDFSVLSFFENPDNLGLSSSLTENFFDSNILYKSDKQFNFLSKIFTSISTQNYTLDNFRDGRLKSSDVIYKFLSEVKKRSLEDVLAYKEDIARIVNEYSSNF